MPRHPTSLTKGLWLLRSLPEAATARAPGIVERHDGDAYDKSFKSWEHLVTFIYAQLSRLRRPSQRMEAGFRRIPACAANAPGSSLGFWRRNGEMAAGVVS
jgi:Domain of unknown function (DUF4372)